MGSGQLFLPVCFCHPTHSRAFFASWTAALRAGGSQAAPAGKVLTDAAIGPTSWPDGPPAPSTTAGPKPRRKLAPTRRATRCAMAGSAISSGTEAKAADADGCEDLAAFAANNGEETKAEAGASDRDESKADGEAEEENDGDNADK